MKKMKVLDDLLVDLVKDLYYAEKKIARAIPKMVKKVSSENLKTALEDHLEETKNHITRLESIFEELEVTPRGKKCHAMDGIIEEGEEVLSMENIEDEVRDAAIIVAAQKVEHYEIASYGSIRTFADILGLEEVSRIAQETLDEESDADEKLTSIARAVNNKAAHEAFFADETSKETTKSKEKESFWF